MLWSDTVLVEVRSSDLEPFLFSPVSQVKDHVGGKGLRENSSFSVEGDMKPDITINSIRVDVSAVSQ
jgi:hypothetical protein